jgi:hypothetical protein
MTLRAATCCLAAILVSACARSGDASSSFSGGSGPETGVAASSGSDSGPGNQDSGGSSTGTSGTGDLGSGEDSSASMPAMSTGTFDVGELPDFDLPLAGCQGKIDFLFVIESWYAMKDSQDKLQVSFKTFTDMIGQEFADFDYHIMVVDASGMPLMPETCSDKCYMCIGCTMPGCGDFGGPLDYPCDYIPSACDRKRGAGVVVTGNFDASNQPCVLFGGNRYIVKGEPDLEGTFKCIASLGQGPKTPAPAWMMMAALEPDMLDGGCNDGFLRDDALLAVIELTGTGDDLSPGTPQSWYDTLVAAKHGNEEAVVILAFSHDNDLPESKCQNPDWGSPAQREFADLAAHGLWESICADSYIPALTKTAEMILEQCAVFVPQ